MFGLPQLGFIRVWGNLERRDGDKRAATGARGWEVYTLA